GGQGGVVPDVEYRLRFSNHVLKSKGNWPKGDRGLGKKESEMLLHKTGMFVQVGSGTDTTSHDTMCYSMAEELSFRKKRIQECMYRLKKLDHIFLSFITSARVMQDLPFGEKTLKLSSKTEIKIPNVIRSSIPEQIVRQYQSYCSETEFSPMSRSSLCRILKVCSASVRKSLQGLDYVSSEGAKAFDDIADVIDKLGDNYNNGLTWSKELAQKLKLAKRYLKGDYKTQDEIEEEEEVDEPEEEEEDELKEMEIRHTTATDSSTIGEQLTQDEIEEEEEVDEPEEEEEDELKEMEIRHAGRDRRGEEDEPEEEEEDELKEMEIRHTTATDSSTIGEQLTQDEIEEEEEVDEPEEEEEDELKEMEIRPTIGIRRAINNGNNNPSGKYLQEFLGLGVREGYWGRELQLATLKQKFRNEEKRVKRQNSSSRTQDEIEEEEEVDEPEEEEEDELKEMEIRRQYQ
ncbi:hypothetical protein QZH41_014902, partial [Actinostola sp. cb2023]